MNPNHFKTRRGVLQLLAATTAAGTSGAWAQSAWPNKPVRIIVPTAAGSGSDLVTRALANKLAVTWKRKHVQQALQALPVVGAPEHGRQLDLARLAAEILDIGTVTVRVFKAGGIAPGGVLGTLAIEAYPAERGILQMSGPAHVSSFGQ